MRVRSMCGNPSNRFDGAVIRGLSYNLMVSQQCGTFRVVSHLPWGQLQVPVLVVVQSWVGTICCVKWRH